MLSSTLNACRSFARFFHKWLQNSNPYLLKTLVYRQLVCSYHKENRKTYTQRYKIKPFVASNRLLGLTLRIYCQFTFIQFWNSQQTATQKIFVVWSHAAIQKFCSFTNLSSFGSTRIQQLAGEYIYTVLSYFVTRYTGSTPFIVYLLSYTGKKREWPCRTNFDLS